MVKRRVANVILSTFGPQGGDVLIDGMSQSSSTPRNRKERRAQARTQARTTERDEEPVPLSRPAQVQPTGKKLLELAEERNLLSPSQPPPSLSSHRFQPDGSLVSLSDNITSTPTFDYSDVALYTISLSLLHFTLTILIETQYASDPPTLSSLPSKVYETIFAAPHCYIILVLVALLHPRAAWPSTQCLFAALSLGCGAWLVHTTNRDAYMATMAKAPSLGTLWVWSVVELRWELAMATVSAVVAWAVGMGYSLR